VVLLLTLTAVTGLVDAVSYLRLGRVFVANMTGNVVFLGFSVAPHTGLSPASSSIALAGFFVGAVVGGRMATVLISRPRRWLVIAFGLETVIVGTVALLSGVGVAAYHGDGRYLTIAVLAAALGIQNSTVRRFGVPDLTTTVLTLTLTGLAADSFLAGGPGAKPYRRIGSVIMMLAGAAAGAGLLQVSTTAVIALAAATVGVVTLGFGLASPPAPDPEAAVPA
jgi:uncharacterized membrane protein YoaK (UPF0700 family)